MATGIIPSQVVVDGLAIVGAVTVLAGIGGAAVAVAIEVGALIRARRARNWSHADVRDLHRRGGAR